MAKGEYQSLQYGDGRLTPSNWIRTMDGRILKEAAMGQDCDHTWVGSQTILWDIAGAQIEWRMNTDAEELLVRHVETVCGFEIPQRTLAFYRAGYCALRLAMTLYDTTGPHSDDQDRFCLHLEAENYRLQLNCDLKFLQTSWVSRCNSVVPC